MRTETLRRALLGMVFALIASATTHAQQMCYPPPAYEPVVFNDVLQPSWFSWMYGSLAGLANDPDNAGNKVLKVQFTRNWGEYIIFRPTSKVWETRGQVALSFRVRGIYNNCEKQVWVQLRDQYGQVYDSLPITDHMVAPPLLVTQECWGNTTTVGLYDPNKWYTVVIPITAFIDAQNVTVKDIVFEGGWLANYGAGDLGTIYLDDIWWVEGLEFPLAGYEADTAPISSVFDHTMTDGSGTVAPYKKDQVVTAFTGEVADGSLSPTDQTCVTGADAPYNGQITNYAGAGVCSATARLDYLSYDGHPGIDYAVADVNVYPVADGTVVSPGRCLIFNAGGTCTGWGAVGVDHGNGYLSQYWHMKDIKVAAGTKVTTNTVLGTASDVGTPGAKHLHFEVALKNGDGYVHVDPYGWTDLSDDDPHRVQAVSIPLWK